MHPVIRISVFLIFSYFIIQAKPGQLLLAGFILFGAGYFQEKKYTQLMWNMIWRLKWFYLSIFILFSLFTPTSFFVGGINSGIYISISKIAALMLIVVAVFVLIISIPRKDLIASLVYLSKPFSIVGFSSEKFAVRVYLIIEFAEDISILINNRTRSIETNSNLKSKIKKIVSSMHLVVAEVYKLAENSECKKIHYDKINLPDYYQWGYLFLIIGLFYISDIVFTWMVL